jgi:Zn-dependent protease with chaperone function
MAGLRLRAAALAAALLLAGCKGTMPGAAPADTAAAPSATASAPSAEAAPDPRAADLRQLQGLDLGMARIPVAQAYLDNLLQRIQAAGPQPARPAQVLIRPKLSYNAATAASGLIIVDLGWLKSIESEAELTALLAHEYGHLVNDHLGSKNQVGSATHYGLMVATALAARAKVDNTLTLSVVNSSWSSLLMPSWSRTQEYESDAFAVETTQAMGLPYVPSVRAFLERIQSVERAAGGPAKAVDGEGRPLPKAEDDHPPIEERIARANRLVEGRPRMRPKGGPDAWRAVRDSAEFRAAEEEYVLAARYLEAVKARRGGDQQAVARAIDARPRPLRTAAAQTLLAWSQPDAARRMPMLEAALALPDASFMPYALLAQTQRDLGRLKDSHATLQAGLDRFDSPYQLWPDVIEFQRSTTERIDALPPAQKTLELSWFGTQLMAQMVALKARCVLNPEVSDACQWASLNAQQRQQQAAQQKAKDEKAARKIEQKVEGLFKRK